MTLSTPLSEIPRIGPATEKRLKKLGIVNVRDLLFHFPRTYEDWRIITPISQVKEGEMYCVRGTILEIEQTRSFKKRMSLVHALVQDSTGAARVLWFNQPYLGEYLKQGEAYSLAGKIIRDKDGIHLSNPSYEKVTEKGLVHTGRIIPVYQETRGLSSKWIRSQVSSLLRENLGLKDQLPPHILKEKEFPPLKEALSSIHFPETLEQAQKAQERFTFEELFSLILFMISERKKIARVKAPAVPLDPELMKRFTDKLPFALTDAQKKAAWRILKDLEQPRPMNRLLQGDVGSGKTVVAAMAALSAAKAGKQVVFMAPTEILAQQHFKTVSRLLSPFRLKIALLTGKTDLWTSPKLPREPIEISRKKLLEKVEEGEMQVVVGTQALIQDKVRFANLALIVLDEQHRFGVKQRAKLSRGDHPLIPHLLSMTATPIPRTLALTLYGDLDLTLISELPKGRQQIQTRVIPPEERREAYAFLKKQMKLRRQVFVICPRIETTEDSKVEMKTVKEEYEKLTKEFKEFKVEMLHGKMPQKEKEQVMGRFARGKADLLVSTSVVEVGVDIPNATVMLIEGADRFGLAQLHQFRGRVGRGEHQSYCFLFCDSDLPKSRERLKAIEKHASGFELAERDLKLRGPGDLAGIKQWGMPDFAMRSLTNLKLVEEVRQYVNQLLDEDVALKKYPALQSLLNGLRARLHLE